MLRINECKFKNLNVVYSLIWIIFECIHIPIEILLNSIKTYLVKDLDEAKYMETATCLLKSASYFCP